MSMILRYFDDFPLPAAPIFVRAYLSKRRLEVLRSLIGSAIFLSLCSREAFVWAWLRESLIDCIVSFFTPLLLSFV